MVLYVKNKRRVEKMKCTSNRDSNVIDKMYAYENFSFLPLHSLYLGSHFENSLEGQNGVFTSDVNISVD